MKPEEEATFFTLLSNRVQEELYLQLEAIRESLEKSSNTLEDKIVIARLDFAIDAVSDFLSIESLGTARKAVSPILNDVNEWEIPYEEVIKFND